MLEPTVPYAEMTPEQLRAAYVAMFAKHSAGYKPAKVRLAIIETVARRRGIDLASPTAPEVG